MGLGEGLSHLSPFPSTPPPPPQIPNPARRKKDHPIRILLLPSSGQILRGRWTSVYVSVFREVPRQCKVFFLLSALLICSQDMSVRFEKNFFPSVLIASMAPDGIAKVEEPHSYSKSAFRPLRLSPPPNIRRVSGGLNNPPLSLFGFFLFAHSPPSVAVERRPLQGS